MTRSRITGTGMAVPDRVVTNDDLAQMMDTSDEWIRQRTGIGERHWITEGETGSGLAEKAARQALAAAELLPANLDAIVCATSSPDHFIPGNGVFIGRQLGIRAVLDALVAVLDGPLAAGALPAQLLQPRQHLGLAGHDQAPGLR